MLASHNSATGYNISYPWWSKGPLGLWAVCQNLTLEEQWERGVRFFDFRVRVKHGGDELVICHGFPEYSLMFREALEILNTLNTEGEDVFILTLYDPTIKTSQETVTSLYESAVQEFDVVGSGSLKFIGLYVKATGEKLVESPWSRPPTTEIHGSVDGWKKILPPIIWSLLWNKETYESNVNYAISDSKFLMLDFVEIGTGS